MILDILNREVNVGDECILTINNKGLVKVRSTKFNKTSLSYDVIHKPNRKVNRASYVILTKTRYNLYKI